jgi:DNA-binding transcriptional LysR family regulator
MDIDNLRIFMEAVRLGSFAAAAREHDLEPSSVSRAVAAIEAELGVRLLQRTTRSMVPTEAGALYYASVSRLIEELDRAQDEAVAARTEPSGPLRLTTSVAFGQICLTPLLPALRAAFPKVQFELLFTDAMLDLIAERIDIAIRIAPDYRGDVVGVKLFPTYYRVVASPRYLKQTGMPKTPRDLSTRSSLLFDLPEFRSRWLFRKGKAMMEVSVQGHLIFSNVLAMKAAAIDGLGPALMADWVIGSDIEAGRLVDLFPAYQVAASASVSAAWLLYPSRAYIPRKVRAVIDWLRQNVRPR